jgi:hypothetical protein
MPTLLASATATPTARPPSSPAASHRRFDADTRWPRVLAALLPGWEVVEEGLPGRTAQFPDPVMGATWTARPALRSRCKATAPSTP